jgi:hypothetical protein
MQVSTEDNGAFSGSRMSTGVPATAIRFGRLNHEARTSQINGTELTWSEEAKKEWIRIFVCEPPSQMA